jgi:hypothetical protein
MTLDRRTVSTVGSLVALLAVAAMWIYLVLNLMQRGSPIP